MTDIIMIDSPDAAKPHTMSGWLSREGYFYAEEDIARYRGCTHRQCDDCGSPAEKQYTHCKACRGKREIERFKARKRKLWDGKAMIYSAAMDSYYSDPADAIEAAEGEGIDEPMLLICEPEYAGKLSIDFFEGQLPEDGDLPTEIEAAMGAFNAAVAGIVLSWLPSEFALDLEGEE